jgi:hypothetical protein
VQRERKGPSVVPAELVGNGSTAVLCQEEVTSEELRVDAKVSIICKHVASEQLFAKQWRCCDLRPGIVSCKIGCQEVLRSHTMVSVQLTAAEPS